MNDFKTSNDNRPIFIHSIFRSGSTYIFKKFRENEELYTCYQEPVHEIGILASEDYEILNQDTGNEKNNQLRHPTLNQSYFCELYHIADKALPYLKKEDIYNNYFSDNVNSLCKFLESIIENSPKRAVIQECRLTSRMRSVKENLGGIHLYLWRNPWDQWWSYKVTDYFDAVNLLILTAESPPEIISEIVKKLKIPNVKNDDIRADFDFYKSLKLSASDSYLVFYTIWLMSLKEAVKHADFIFNIDKLSTSDDYKKSVSNELHNQGIFGVEFLDCEVPQAHFSTKDFNFFDAIESSVHDLMSKSDDSSDVLDKIFSLRNKYSTKNEIKNIKETSRDSERARELSRMYMTDLSILQQKSQSDNFDSVTLIEQAKQSTYKAEVRARKLEANAIWLEVKVDEEKARVNIAEAKTNEAEARAREAEVRAHEAGTRHSEAEAKLCQVELKLEQANIRISSLLSSSSWRLTLPFRALRSWMYNIPIKCKLLCVKIVRKLIQYPLGFITKHPKLKIVILKLIRKSTVLEKLTRVIYVRKQQHLIAGTENLVLTERGNNILNEIKRAKKL